jgi:hypothetical protein
LLVSVAEGTTDGFGETDLGTGLEEVLSLEDILWGKLSEIFFGSYLTREKRGGETGTLLHTTIHGGCSGANDRTATEANVLALIDGVVGSVVKSSE